MLKILSLSVLLTAFILTAPLALPAQQANDSAATQELIALSNEWMQALERKDRNRLEQIMHRDFFILGIVDDHEPTDREQWLKNGLESMDWGEFQYRDFNVSVLGDTAVVRSTLDFTVRRRTGFIRQVSTASPLVDVWVRQDGKWQIIRRYAAPWTVKRWADRGIGFLAGALSTGILILFARRFLSR